MPVYTFTPLPAGEPATIYPSAGGASVGSGTADTNGVLTSTLSTGNYVARNTTGHYWREAQGTTPVVSGIGPTGPTGPAGVLDIVSALTTWAQAQSFRLVSATRDSNSAITTASIVWPDGGTGTFTTTTASTTFPGAIDAYTITYSLSGVTKTVTQTAVTRDANGAVTAQPGLTVV